MHVKLVVVGGDAKTTEVRLKLPAVLGRGREATLTLPHALVSRRHCEIVERNGQLLVRDLGSLNGTFVGNERVEEGILKPGELLTVGTVTFRAVYDEQPSIAPPSGDAAPPDVIPAPPDGTTIPVFEDVPAFPDGAPDRDTPAEVSLPQAVQLDQPIDGNKTIQADDSTRPAPVAARLPDRDEPAFAEAVNDLDDVELVDEPAMADLDDVEVVADPEPEFPPEVDEVPEVPEVPATPAPEISAEAAAAEPASADDDDLNAFLRGLG